MKLRELLEVEDELMDFMCAEGVAPYGWTVQGIACVEVAGRIVDLTTGKSFVQVDSWVDFAERWVQEIERRGEVPSEERLARAIYRANAGKWSTTFCNAVAYKTLPLAMAVEGSFTVQAS
jgi:hypothetical protein